MLCARRASLWEVRTLGRFINYALIAAIGAWWGLFHLSEGRALALLREDGIVQIATVVFLMAGAVLFYRVARGYLKFYSSKLILRGFMAFLALSLFIAGEELSWGQHLFEFKTPRVWSEINVQNETTLPNLVGIQGIRHWLLIIAGGVGLMLLRRNSWLRRVMAIPPWSAFLPARNLGILFTLVLASGVALEVGEVWMVLSQDSEVARRFRYLASRFSEIGELLVAIAAFSYSAAKYREMKLGVLEPGSPC